jgi:Na+-translocating ferredoxin:NAD+ oxidoreductase RnfG subunit
MNRLSSIKFISFVLIFLLSTCICSTLQATTSAMATNEISESPPQRKKTKIKKPMSANKARKQAEAKDKKRRKESDQYIKWNRKRSIEIQTPEVQQRMKQNIRDANARYKTKKKNSTSRTKKARRKYK